MRYWFICLIAVLVVAFPLTEVQAQQSCEEVLTRARESFDAGHLYGIPATLKPCLDNGFDRSQRIQAYFLLTRTYLLIDDPISAEDSFLKLLKLDPEYQIDEERDPIDIVYLNEKFTTTPIFVLFARAGFNVTSASVIHNFGTDNTALTQENYTAKVGFEIAGGAELNFNDNISLGMELVFARKSYAYENTFFNGDQQMMEETLTMASLPIFLKYRTKHNKFRPYGYLGYSNDFILSASGSLSLIDRITSTSEEDAAEFEVTGPDVGLTEQRTFYNSSLIFGLGTHYRIGYDYLTFDIRYSLGLSNIVDVQNQYSNPELVYKYGYVDDYKSIKNLTISIGFVRPLYKPRKKAGSVKGFFNQIFNRN